MRPPPLAAAGSTIPAAVSECPWLREPGKERTMTTAEHVRVGVRHPLDPLTAEEIEDVLAFLMTLRSD